MILLLITIDIVVTVRELIFIKIWLIRMNEVTELIEVVKSRVIRLIWRCMISELILSKTEQLNLSKEFHWDITIYIKLDVFLNVDDLNELSDDDLFSKYW